MTPDRVWELELWEFNSYITGYQERQKGEVANAIMAGYYCAYYTNGGKKAKSPNDLIKKLYQKQQSKCDGVQQIEIARAIEKRLKNKEVANGQPSKHC